MEAKGHRILPKIERFARFVHKYFYEKVYDETKMKQIRNYTLLYHNPEFIYTDIEHNIDIASIIINKLHGNYYELRISPSVVNPNETIFLFTKEYIIPFYHIDQLIKNEIK